MAVNRTPTLCEMRKEWVTYKFKILQSPGHPPVIRPVTAREDVQVG